jgi:hypothetical protein
MKKFFAFVLISVTACNTNNFIQTKAYLFERKMLNDGNLMVHYVFNAGKILLEDSSIVENKVLPQDSIMIEFKKENPGESKLIK